MVVRAREKTLAQFYRSIDVEDGVVQFAFVVEAQAPIQTLLCCLARLIFRHDTSAACLAFAASLAARFK